MTWNVLGNGPKDTMQSPASVLSVMAWKVETIIGKSLFEYLRIAIHLAFQHFLLKLPNLLFVLL